MLLDFRINNIFLDILIKKYKPHYIYSERKNFKNLKIYKNIFKKNNYNLFMKKKSEKIKLNEKLMLMMSTSGSTGSPKFVRLSYENIKSNTSSIIKCLNIKASDITITSLPISYVYGLSIFNTHLFSGSIIVMTNKSIVEKTFWELVHQNKVSSFGGVPFQYSIIEKIFRKNFPKSLRYTTQAGGKMNNVLINKILKIYKKNNVKFIQMYGAAEATARMSYLKWKDAKNKIGSIGKEIPGGKFHLIGETGKKIEKKFHKGELVFEGKNVFMGYAEKLEDLSLPDINKGLLKTGDVAYKDNENFYYITGRKNRFTKIYGARINLSELEEILFKKGIDVFMKDGNENQILCYFNNLYNLRKGIKFLSKLTSINSKVFLGKIIQKKNLTTNLKFKL